MVQKKQLIISSIFNGGNIIFLIYYLYDSIIHQIDLLHITRWSYFLNSIFTTISLICDIIIYRSENEDTDMNYTLMIDENNKEKNKDFISKIKELDDWNNNKFGNICNSLCYFVSVGFWFLFFFGNRIMKISQSIKSVFNCIYHHCIIQIIIIINIFNSKRKKHHFSWFYFGIIFSIYLFYCCVIGIEKYFFQKDAYYFMKNQSEIFLFFCFIFSGLFLFLSYLLHIFILDIKFKIQINKDKYTEDVDEKQTVNDSEKNLLDK